MRISKLLGAAIVASFLASGCITSPHPHQGAIYSGFTGPNQGKDGGKSDKKGESCATSVLGLVGWGDASIETARQNGKIGTISTVDYRKFSILAFVYNQTCAVVAGI